LELNAGYLMMNDNYNDAISNLINSKDIYEKYLDREHATLSRVYLNLAIGYYNNSEYLNSIAYVQRALNSVSGLSCDSDYSSNPAIDKLSSSDIAFEILLRKAELLIYLSSFETDSVKLLTAALSTYVLASNWVDKKNAEITSESSRMLLGEKVSNMYEDAISAGYKLYKLTNDKKILNDILLLFEKSKAGTLLQAINNAKAKKFSGVPDSLTENESRLKKTIFEKNRLLKIETENNPEPGNEYAGSLKKEIFNLNYQLQNLIKLFEDEYIKYYKLKYSSNLDPLKSLRDNVLSNNKIVVEYYLGKNNIYVLVISNKNLNVYRLNRPFDLEDNIDKIRTAIISHNKEVYRQQSFELYSLLFAPFEKDLSSDNIIIIPDKALYYLPFEALTTEKSNETNINYKEIKYLVKKFKISYSFSCDLLNQTSTSIQKPSDCIASFAPVNFRKVNMKSIPFTKNEIMSIDNLFTQKGLCSDHFLYEEASEDNFKKLGPNKYGFIHLATHGLVDKENPEYSRIILPVKKGSNEDGYLYIGEVYNLNLKTDLITLSACETGLGKIVRGEGIISFARSFIYAGAANIIVSLWPVDDEATQILMIKFYSELINSKSKSGSLQFAKTDIINSSGQTGSDFSDPYYWSSFVLIGN
jgi:CHAT domain-containing protein